MKTERKAPANIDDYIVAFPPDVRSILEKIRATIRKAAPDAAETISYQIPTFTLGGNLVHFAAFKHHIGLYPPVRSDAKLRADVAAYANEKGNLRFPLEKRIPYSLISRIVKARVRENVEKAEKRQKKIGARTRQ
jgi:uncharacterized protein YdhG (YjbR/CyaY superfamily)